MGIPADQGTGQAATRAATRRTGGGGGGGGGGGDRAFDFELFGHHLIAYAVTGAEAEVHQAASAGSRAAIRHFGVVIDQEQWRATVDRLRRHGAPFVFGPVTRHDGTDIEESLALVTDPSGNAVELKTFADPDRVFAVGDRSVNAERGPR